MPCTVCNARWAVMLSNDAIVHAGYNRVASPAKFTVWQLQKLEKKLKKNIMNGHSM